MHVTYASPGAAEYYRKAGKFADGVVLVKEIYSTDHAELTTGTRIGQKGLCVVRHDQGYERALSGQSTVGRRLRMGLFKADAPDKQVATAHQKNCLGCHIPAKEDDWVYIRGYPVLASAK